MRGPQIIVHNAEIQKYENHKYFWNQSLNITFLKLILFIVFIFLHMFLCIYIKVWLLCGELWELHNTQYMHQINLTKLGKF